MASIKNLKTGITMECNNQDVIQVCKKDTENFKVSEKSTKKPKIIE